MAALCAKCSLIDVYRKRELLNYLMSELVESFVMT